MATKPAKKVKKVVKKPAPAKKVAAPKKAKAVKAVAKAKPKAAATTKAKSATKTTAASPAAAGQKVRSIAKPRSSSGAYTQSEFLEHVRAFCGLTKRSQAKELSEDIALLVKETLKKGYKIPFFGLGKLYVRETKARMGKNPQTGAAIKIPAKKRVRFTPAKVLKELVK